VLAARAGLFEETASCFALKDPTLKCAAVAELAAGSVRGELRYDPETGPPAVEQPGRPDRPLLIDPARVPRRRLGNLAGRIALVHAIAHIEFNAINLALDAACRFRNMPQEYHRDWIKVAADEARHFSMLAARLAEWGVAYGDFPAHNGLWEMAERTADSCLVRMALVPRVLEARGLDVTPGMIARLKQSGDEDTLRILETILTEEISHVAIGTRWFAYCCEREGKDPAETFIHLLETCNTATVRGPFNRVARLQAGFTALEMERLETL
jgi:uncharacterized ferritin-like protein (DUF455 family)